MKHKLTKYKSLRLKEETWENLNFFKLVPTESMDSIIQRLMRHMSGERQRLSRIMIKQGGKR